VLNNENIEKEYEKKILNTYDTLSDLEKLLLTIDNASIIDTSSIKELQKVSKKLNSIKNMLSFGDN